MSDLISRQAAIDALEKHEKSQGHNYSMFRSVVSECAEVILDLPSTEPQWIPCSDRLPESDKNVLAQLKDCEFDPILIMSLHACHTEDGWWWYWKTQEESIEFESDEIIAWQPLPEPYQEGDHDTD